MEVTRTNFQEVLTELDDVLSNATFLAIDGEFTGLNSGPDANAFDTPAQYYAKLRTGSMNFLLVQLGLSVFKYNSASDKFSQRSYNFYVFPRPFNRSTPDCRFMCQASSITFLANQGFDFNKLFKYGIPYLTKEEEEKLNKKLEEKQKAREEEEFDLIPIPDHDSPKIEEICSKIEIFIDSEDNEFIIDKCNAFIRRLIYQEVRIRWPNSIKLESKSENGNQYLVAYKIGSDDEEKVREAGRREKEKLEVQKAVGLSALLRKVADAGKLIVGHNMLLDLCHIIHQFFGPLPESYNEFKSLVHCLFPKLLDTKIICQSSHFKDSLPSVLNHLLETLQLSFDLPETEDVENRSYTVKNDKSHEAGYDAYITGLCFISLCNKLGSLQRPETPIVLPDSPLLNSFINKLLIARLKDYPHINLIGKDPNPSRDHVFHITFPKHWKTSDLSQIFSPYGGAYVSWLSDTTAYVALHRREQVSAVIKNLFKSTKYNLQRYVDHQASLEKEKAEKPVKSERKRKISESDGPAPGAGKKEPAAPAGPNNGKPGQPSVPGATSPERSNDGWEVASGNDRHSKLAARVAEADATRVAGAPSRPAAATTTPARPDPEEFSLVRKARPKSGGAGKPARLGAGNGVRIPAGTRYTILRGLDTEYDDDDEEDEDGEAGAAKGRKALGKRSPKKPAHNGLQRRRRQAQSDDSPRRQPKKSAQRPRAAGLAGWFTCLRMLQFAGVLAVVYFFTVS